MYSKQELESLHDHTHYNGPIYNISGALTRLRCYPSNCWIFVILGSGLLFIPCKAITWHHFCCAIRHHPANYFGFINLNPEQTWYIGGLMQYCSNPIANLLELLQFCTRPSIFYPSFILIVISLQKLSIHWTAIPINSEKTFQHV